MKLLLLVLFLPLTCHAGICGRPCRSYLPLLEPQYCQPMEIDPCVQLLLDDLSDRGVGNVAHMSQTGSSGGGQSTSWISTSSSSIGWDYGFVPIGLGGNGGVGNVPSRELGGGQNGTGNGNTVIPSKEIPEPSSLLMWLLIGGVLWLIQRRYSYSRS